MEDRVVNVPVVEPGAILILVLLSGRCMSLRTNLLDVNGTFIYVSIYPTFTENTSKCQIPCQVGKTQVGST